jgi:hypothetical protein
MYKVFFFFIISHVSTSRENYKSFRFIIFEGPQGVLNAKLLIISGVYKIPPKDLLLKWAETGT